MIALSGVRSSCDMLARNSDLCLFATSSCALFSWISLNRRTFSIAITAWSAKVVHQLDLLLGERSRLAVRAQRTAHRSARPRAASAPRGCCDSRLPRTRSRRRVRSVGAHVGNVHRDAARRSPGRSPSSVGRGSARGGSRLPSARRLRRGRSRRRAADSDRPRPARKMVPRSASHSSRGTLEHDVRAPAAGRTWCG